MNYLFATFLIALLLMLLAAWLISERRWHSPEERLPTKPPYLCWVIRTGDVSERGRAVLAEYMDDGRWRILASNEIVESVRMWQEV